MKKGKKSFIAFCAGLFLLFAGPAMADSGEFGMALKAGTLGAGIEGTIGITKTINTRLGVNYFSYDTDETESNVDYEFDIELKTFSWLFDWHPGGGGFRITAGAFYNGNEFEAVGKPRSGSYTIDDTTYPAAQVGTLKGEIDFDNFAPYVGIGYGNALSKDRKWNFVFDLGVMYQGEPDVTLTADGTASGNAVFQSELENERRQLESDIDDFEFYPVLFLGVSYKF